MNNDKPGKQVEERRGKIPSEAPCYAQGGLVGNGAIPQGAELLLPGETRVSKKVLEKYGADLLRRLNSQRLPTGCEMRGETIVLIEEA